MDLSQDLGVGDEFTPGAAATEEQVSDVQVDSTVEAQAAISEGAETELTDEEFDKVRQELQEAVKDERTPAFFRKQFPSYERRIDSLTEQLKPYQSLETYGTIEDIQRNLETVQKLRTTRTNAQGFPEVTTQPFVEDLDNETRLQLLKDLTEVESPFTPGYTLMQEIFKATGIPPERLPEIKNFLQNGYQGNGAHPSPEPSELEQVREDLRATFSKLSPDERYDLLTSSELTRNNALENAKFRMDREENEKLTAKEREEKEQQQTQQVEVEFQNQVQETGQLHYAEAGAQVLTSFVESLKSVGLSNLDSLKVANMVVNTLEEPDTATAKMNMEAFKEAGIDVDPQLPALVAQLKELSRHQGYYEKAIERAQKDAKFAQANDIQSLTARKNETITKQVEVRDRLTAKGNKIVASLAKLSAQGNVTTAQQQNTLLDRTITRPNVNGQPTAIGNGHYDDVELEEAVRADPFFARN